MPTAAMVQPHLAFARPPSEAPADPPVKKPKKASTKKMAQAQQLKVTEERASVEPIMIDDGDQNTTGDSGFSTPPPKTSPATPTYADAEVIPAAQPTPLDSPDGDDEDSKQDASHSVDDKGLSSSYVANVTAHVNAEATKAIERAAAQGQTFVDTSKGITIKPDLGKREKNFAEALKEFVMMNEDMDPRGKLAQKMNRDMSPAEKSEFAALSHEDKKGLPQKVGQWRTLVVHAGTHLRGELEKDRPDARRLLQRIALVAT